MKRSRAHADGTGRGAWGGRRSAPWAGEADGAYARNAAQHAARRVCLRLVQTWASMHFALFGDMATLLCWHSINVVRGRGMKDELVSLNAGRTKMTSFASGRDAVAGGGLRPFLPKTPIFDLSVTRVLRGLATIPANWLGTWRALLGRRARLSSRVPRLQRWLRRGLENRWQRTDGGWRALGATSVLLLRTPACPKTRLRTTLA